MAKKCPICGKVPVETFKPFCSGHCADLDLGKWIKGDYRVPLQGDEAEEADDSLESPSSLH